MKRSLFWLIFILISSASCSRQLSTEDARKQLGAMGLQYNEQTFIDCARNGDITAVRLFLSAGMSPDVKDPLNRVAFDYADTYPTPLGGPQRANLEWKDGLSKIGTPRPDQAMTALMVAAFAGRVDVVKTLIAKRADLDATDRLDMTALDYADLAGRKDIAQLLESAGAKTSSAQAPIK